MTFKADQEPVERVLRAAFQEAARGVDPEGGTARRIGQRVRRRRRHAVVASIVAVAAAVAGTVTVGWGSKGGGAAVLQPATPRPVRDTLFGVTVSWLPAGAHRTAGFVDMLKGPPEVSSRYTTAKPDVAAPDYTVRVTRGQLNSLDELRREAVEQVTHTPGGSPTAVGWTTVHGRHALRVTYPDPGPTERYSIIWQENGAQLTAEASDGGTFAQAARLANGLVVGRVPAGPSDPTRATTEIRAAIRQAFTGPTPEKAVEAVEDGARLRATLEQAIATGRTQLRNVQVVGTDPIIFLDATEAAALYTVREPLNGLPKLETVMSTVRLILTPAGWKVSRVDFCDRMGGIGVTCPSR